MICGGVSYSARNISKMFPISNYWDDEKSSKCSAMFPIGVGRLVLRYV